MDKIYLRALFEELKVNEGLLDTENGFDDSVAGVSSKYSQESIIPLVRQALCIVASAESGSSSEAIILDDCLFKLNALMSDNKFKAGIKSTNSPKPKFDTNLFNELIPANTTKNMDKVSKYFEQILADQEKSRGRQASHNAEMMKNLSLDQKKNTESPQKDEKKKGDFVTAGQMLGRPPPPSTQSNGSKVVRKGVGLSKRVKRDAPQQMEEPQGEEEEKGDPRFRGIDPKLLETIQNEIIHKVDTVTWDQIAGLEHAKQSIKEIVIWPMLRPDIFTGLRGPPKGLMLFGPPGTGKTMIGKCIASQANATFFSISASSLTSKWVGEGEKLVRALFGCARVMQPSVVFIDEIDSLLSQRSDGEFEASRRIKTEFLVQFDGASTSSEDRILIIGATNRPQELDEAARRRLVKRLYIPLPDTMARSAIITSLLKNQNNSLTASDVEDICKETDGYSGADMENLCKEAALGPIRSIKNILEISSDQVRPIKKEDFVKAMSQVRASVSDSDLQLYIEWNKKFGSLS